MIKIRRHSPRPVNRLRTIYSKAPQNLEVTCQFLLIYWPHTCLQHPEIIHVQYPWDTTLLNLQTRWSHLLPGIDWLGKVMWFSIHNVMQKQSGLTLKQHFLHVHHKPQKRQVPCRLDLLRCCKCPPCLFSLSLALLLHHNFYPYHVSRKLRRLETRNFADCVTHQRLFPCSTMFPCLPIPTSFKLY